MNKAAQSRSTLSNETCLTPDLPPRSADPSPIPPDAPSGRPGLVHLPRPEDDLPDLFDARQWQALATFFHLTPRQTEIATRLCRGATNKQIAHCLGLSPHTVRMHVNELMRRLRVVNRLGVVVQLVLADRANRVRLCQSR